MRRDIVLLSCGDHDFREVFECARVRLFVVDYADPDGGEWTFPVTSEQAGVDLMLDLASASAATAPTGPVPPQLRITVARVGQAWRITNGDPFRWPQCIASIGASEAPIGALEANAAVMVNPSQFQPPLADPATKSAIAVTCTVGRDKSFVATGRP